MDPRRFLAAAALLALTLAPAAAAAPDEPEPETIFARVKTILAEKDTYAAAEYVQSLGMPPVVAKAYEQLVMDLHWKAKDAAGVVAMGRAGILYMLTKAAELAEKSPEKAAAWRSHAKAVAYNVGSFTWPGWELEGLTLTEAEVGAGRDAAALDLRLAQELGKPPGALSAAFWLVGAHDLASGDGAAALSAFGKARAFSKEAKDEEGELMAAGYAAIARLLTKEEGAEQELRTAVEALRARNTDDAKFYADQIVMAQRMLAAWWKAHHLR